MLPEKPGHSRDFASIGADESFVRIVSLRMRRTPASEPRAATVTTRPFPASTGTTRMTISIADVQRLAHLARIEIDAVEAEDVRAKLDAIFAMINQLRAVDTTGVAPMAHAQDVCLPLRADKVTEADRHSLYQSVAPAVEDGLYLVPKVIE
jgi:aspartyl-tRNA(Asn)/glutamyl-tRNA(Gln) amidotransferase subunit C